MNLDRMNYPKRKWPVRSGPLADRRWLTRGCGLRRSSGAARRGPGARRRGGGRAGDRQRDLDGNVPDAALQQSSRLAELVVPFWVVLVLGRVPEGFGELVDEAFGGRPLANRLAGFRGHLEHVPEPGIAPGLRLAEVHIRRVQRVQRLGDLGQVESRPFRDVADRDHVALLQQRHDRVEHRHLAWSPRVFQGPPLPISGGFRRPGSRQAAAIGNDYPAFIAYP